MANTKPTLLDGLLKRRLSVHGQLVTKGGITFDLMIGRVRGTRPIGRPRTTWLKDLVTSEGVSVTRQGRQMSEGVEVCRMRLAALIR